MALYTLLVKVDEDERSVRYRFGPAEGRMGLVELDKVRRLVRELESVPGVSTQTDLSNARKQLLAAPRPGERLSRRHCLRGVAVGIVAGGSRDSATPLRSPGLCSGSRSVGGRIRPVCDG